ncbi:MAG: hypothetical protein IPO27_10215 [Bacteroidetes bacterium]|nr:hypothetical protein [Bacteroidota bacterium]
MVAQYRAASIPETICQSSSGQINFPTTYQTSNDIFIGNVNGVNTEFSIVAWAGVNGELFSMAIQ